MAFVSGCKLDNNGRPVYGNTFFTDTVIPMGDSLSVRAGCDGPSGMRYRLSLLIYF